MTTLTATYCAFCEWVEKKFQGMIDLFESIGYARAASQLASMGKYEEAKALMMYKRDLDSKK